MSGRSWMLREWGSVDSEHFQVESYIQCRVGSNERLSRMPTFLEGGIALLEYPLWDRCADFYKQVQRFPIEPLVWRVRTLQDEVSGKVRLDVFGRRCRYRANDWVNGWNKLLQVFTQPACFDFAFALATNETKTKRKYEAQTKYLVEFVSLNKEPSWLWVLVEWQSVDQWSVEVTLDSAVARGIDPSLGCIQVSNLGRQILLFYRICDKIWRHSAPSHPFMRTLGLYGGWSWSVILRRREGSNGSKAKAVGQ